MIASLRWIAVSLVALALAAGARADEPTGTPLGYHMPAGESFALDVHVAADVPTQGHKETTAKTQTRVESVIPDGLRLHVDVNLPSALERYALAMGVDLSPTGNASNITGVDMSNENNAVVAKDVASLGVPALPDAPVAIGTSWVAERPVYIPKAPIPGVPSTIRVRFTYTVKGFASMGGRDIVYVDLTAKEPDGQSVKVQATGNWVVDAATGKPRSAHIEGAASLHVVFSDLKLPFKIDASTSSSQFANSR